MVTLMPRRSLTAVLGLLAAATVGLSPAAADEGAVVSTDERDCVETGVARAVTTAGLDPLVPERYTLLAVSATASRLTVITYTCQDTAVTGSLPLKSDGEPTTVTIAAATVTHRDGQPLPTEQQLYVVWYGTDNLELFVNFRRAGLPASYLPRSSATVNAGTGDVAWSIRGAGLSYDQIATNPLPDPDGPRDSTVVFWHDGPRGDLRLTFSNSQLEETTAVVTADFTSNEILTEIIALPRLLTVTDVRFPYVRGSWTSTVETVSLDRSPER
jgi:hypothetical protein